MEKYEVSKALFWTLIVSVWLLQIQLIIYSIKTL